MARAKTRSKRGEAICSERRTRHAVKELTAFLRETKRMAAPLSTCCTGDEGYFPVELSHDRTSLIVG